RRWTCRHVCRLPAHAVDRSPARRAEVVRVNSLLGWAALAGLALGVGLWSLVSLTPALGRPRLVNRVAPYLVDVSERARELERRRSTSPLPVIGSLLAPVAESLRAFAD